MSRGNRIDTASIRGPGWLRPVLSGVCVFAIGFILWQWALHAEQQSRQEQFEAVNGEIAALLDLELGEANRAVRRMADRWTAEDGTPKTRWEADARGYVEDFGFFQAMGWVDKDYFVRWIVPLEGNEAAIDFNLGSEARRKETLDRGQATGELATTPLIDLVQGGKGFINYFPVYANDEFNGFISSVFRVQELFDKITASVQDTHVVQIYGEDDLIYSSVPDGGIQVDGLPYTTRALTTVGRDWEIRIADKGATYRVDGRLSNLVLLFSVATSILITLLVRYLMLSSARGQLAEDGEKRFAKLLYDHRKITDSVPVLIAEFDRDKCYRFTNKTYRDWFGFDAESIIGKKASDVLGPAFEEVEPHMDKALSGEAVSYEVQIPKEGEGVRWVQAKYSPSRGANGGITGFFAIVMDVHDTRIAEKELSRQLRLHESIVNNTSAVVYSKALNGKYLGANRQFERLFGLSPGEAIGKTDHELFPESIADAFITNDVAVAKKRDTIIVEEIAPHDDGDHYYISTKFPLFDENEKMFAVAGVSTDITDLKQKSEELELKTQQLESINADLIRSNEELDKFAYVASHDLKAPCRAIDNLASWIAEDAADALSESSLSDLELLRSRARRMETLLDDLLQYSRAGRETKEPETIELVEEIGSIVELLHPSEGMKVEVMGAPLTMRTRIAPFRQVVMNLIGNAIKHHDRDEGFVEVDWTEADEFVELVISDDGPGIPKEHQERVFEMFQTLRPRDEVEGSGMGMAIVKKVAIAVGATIVLESAGRGTTVRVRWPREM